MPASPSSGSPPTRLRRAARGLATAALTLAFLASPVSWGRADDDDGAKAGADRTPRCLCEERDACYHFLNAPVEAPAGPCACPVCTPSHVHGGDRVVPGWNPECWVSQDLDCFLKRHAASWRLVCSECVAAVKCCPRAHPERCPRCQEGDAKSPWPKDAEKTVRERLEVERKVFPRGDPVVVVAPHVYVVSGIRKPKVGTQPTGLRTASAHEYAHVVAMRGEQAYREFCDLVGRPGLGRPVGIFLSERESDAQALQAVYFRNPRAQMIYSSYGGSSASAISEGYCLNGFSLSSQRTSDDDRQMHQAIRHLLANVFFTNWVVQNGEERTTPPWAFEGIAHWFGRRPEALAEQVYYCEGEDNRMGGSGKGWMRDLAAAAAKGTLRPISQILTTRALGKLSYDDLRQSWGWFQVAMEDSPKQWVDLLGAVRREVDVHEAFRAAYGFGAEEFQARFVARITGVRTSLLDREPPAGAVPADRDDSPRAVVARIRAAPPPADRESATALLARLGDASDAVRETAYSALLRAAGKPAFDAVVSAGLSHPTPMVRAYAARLCRDLRMTEARDALRPLLDDPSWFVRSEAALASLEIRDWDSQARVRAMLGDPSPKVRIAASDALRRMGRDANPVCVPPLLANLTHADWQVRIATCQALAVLGDVSAVRPLVERMPVDGGRVAEEIREALKAITGDDLGPDAARWKEWWDRQEPEARAHGFPERKVRPGDERYGPEPAKEHGIQLAAFRVGFVVDLSRSTNRAFTASQATADLLLGGERQGTIQSLCRAQVAHLLKACDSRTRFNVWAFHTSVSRWANRLEPATRSNVDAAVGFLRARTPENETDFHGALRAALDVQAGDDWSPSFRDTPDTLLLLTDGTPTEGDVTDPDVLARWFTEMNRYARMRVHTVAFGALGVDERFLRTLARRNGGEFTQVSEMNPR